MLLRVGLVAVFLYAAVSSLGAPAEWLSYMPAFLTRLLTGNTLIRLFAVYELLLVAWLISGKLIRHCALLCALTFVAIVIMNTEQLIITFRDVGLVCMALALYALA